MSSHTDEFWYNETYVSVDDYIYAKIVQKAVFLIQIQRFSYTPVRFLPA